MLLPGVVFRCVVYALLIVCCDLLRCGYDSPQRVLARFGLLGFGMFVVYICCAVAVCFDLG